jgi:large subunit ribosomal protein L30
MVRKKAVATVNIRLIRSATGSPLKVKKVVQGLGLRKIDQTVERPDDDAIWGMIRKVPHLVEVSR